MCERCGKVSMRFLILGERYANKIFSLSATQARLLDTAEYTLASGRTSAHTQTARRRSLAAPRSRVIKTIILALSKSPRQQQPQL